MSPPATIGRYTLKRELGRGGMATVYLAHDPRFGRDVAIKVLPPQFTHDPRFLERFAREARTIAALEHFAIVPVYDFGEHENAPYLVMRYMRGGTLRERMTGRPLPLDEIVRIVDRLAPALDKAHQRGIIHRDLKPGNVLFDEDDQPYLADFGIARIAEATQTMTVVGTPAYMSPEQLQGDQQLDGRSDIYALGVMLFEMLTGSQPYAADTPAKQMMQHLLDPIPDVRGPNPTLSEETQVVIDRVMAKDRTTRYATGAELAAALRTVRTGSGAFAAAAPPEPEPAEPPQEWEAARTQVEPISDPGLATVVEPVVAEQPLPGRESLSAAEPAPAAGGGGRSVPAWLWWAGAIAALALVFWGMGAVFGGGGGGEEPDAAASATAASAAVVAVTATPEPLPTSTTAPTDTATPTPTSTATSTPTPTPTATPDPIVPPPNPTLGSTWVRPVDEMTMVYVPRGTFAMGSEAGDSDELPVHDVTLDGFWIDRTEVTNAQYAAFLNENGNQSEGGATWLDIGDEDARIAQSSGAFRPAADFADHPVTEVTWYGARAYCVWAGGRLPTEAEWEYAARGPDGNTYPWGSTSPTCELAQYGDCGGGRTIPVGSLPDGASWIGALDMAGNVWEWVNDWYDSDYYEDAPARNPQGPESGEYKVLRGGSWSVDIFQYVRAVFRLYDGPTGSGSVVGFRCTQE